MTPNRRIVAMLEGFNTDLPEGAKRLRVDGTDRRIAAVLKQEDTSPQSLAWRLENLQDQVIELVTGEAWPRCPTHGRHPVVPTDVGWICRRSGQHWDYGSMHDQVIPPDSQLPDGEVRWFLEDRGWGVIAHHEGDLFVHYHFIQGSGYRVLVEGEQVDFEVRPGGQQGKLRQATNVRRRPPSDPSDVGQKG